MLSCPVPWTMHPRSDNTDPRAFLQAEGGGTTSWRREPVSSYFFFSPRTPNHPLPANKGSIERSGGNGPSKTIPPASDFLPLDSGPRGSSAITSPGCGLAAYTPSFHPAPLCPSAGGLRRRHAALQPAQRVDGRPTPARSCVLRPARGPATAGPLPCHEAPAAPPNICRIVLNPQRFYFRWLVAPNLA